jgi:hypothetical protein
MLRSSCRFALVVMWQISRAWVPTAPPVSHAVTTPLAWLSVAMVTSPALLST